MEQDPKDWVQKAVAVSDHVVSEWDAQVVVVVEV
jgi:hypothetical protein